MSTIQIGGRVGFSTFDEIQTCFEKVDFPIELALPWKYRELWLPIESKLNAILDFFKNSKLDIHSIHATQGRITDSAFMDWGYKTLQFADALNVKWVTIHPNQVKSKEVQEKALGFIQSLEYGSSARFCIETFDGPHRLFQPIDIMEQGLPMTLDISHIRDDTFIYEIVEKNWPNIKVLHLSAKNEH